MPPTDAAALRAQPAVQTWYEGLRSQSDVDPDAEPDRLEILARFCDRVGRTPDEIIADCVRQTGDGARLRLKARRHYAEQIAAFQAVAPGDAREKARWGNTIRSFLIHNGIFLQAGAALR
jgi:hypothetical protein